MTQPTVWWHEWRGAFSGIALTVVLGPTAQGPDDTGKDGRTTKIRDRTRPLALFRATTDRFPMSWTLPTAPAGLLQLGGADGLGPTMTYAGSYNSPPTT